ncbi:hypothetical protein IW150_001710 [Coemansia sp. RSA 2607]|nr:hypothetical protein IW150_001710 [Coemansia sp. RSA 2607]
MLMLLMLTLKLSLVRVQASDAKMPYAITEPGAVEAETERLEAVKAAAATAANEGEDKGEYVLERKSEASSSSQPLAQSSHSSHDSAASKGWFQRKFLSRSQSKIEADDTSLARTQPSEEGASLLFLFRAKQKRNLAQKISGELPPRCSQGPQQEAYWLLPDSNPSKLFY